MFNLKTIDGDIINFVQSCYLWLFDRFGIYIGSLMFVMYVSHIAMSNIPIGAAVRICFIVLSSYLWSGPVYLLQAKHDLITLNSRQRLWTTFRFRKIVTILSFSVVLLDAAELHVRDVISDILLIIFMYLGCVQARDREPPEKLVLAKQGM